MAAPTCWLADGPGHLAMVSVLNFYYLTYFQLFSKSEVMSKRQG